MRKKVSLRVKVTMVYGHFQMLWTEKYGSFGHRFSGVDRTRTSELLKALGTLELKKRIENYFLDDGHWLIEHTHPYRVFISQIDRYQKRRMAHGSQEGCQRIVDRDCFDVERENAKWNTNRYA